MVFLQINPVSLVTASRYQSSKLMKKVITLLIRFRRAEVEALLHAAGNK